MSPLIITFIILGIAVLLFITERVPAYVTTVFVPLALVWTNVIDLNTAFEGFINTTILTLAGMYVVGRGMMDTGIAWRVANWLAPLAKDERQATVIFFLIAAIMSAFTPNVGAAVMLFPIVLIFAKMKHFQPSKVLMPYIFGANVGGISTMMGTPLAPALQNAIAEHGNTFTIGFFDFTMFGVPTIIACALYFWFVGYRLLPNNGLEVKGGINTDDVDDYADVPVWKQLMVVLAVCAIASSMIFDGMPSMPQMSMTAAIILVFTGVVSPENAIQAINLKTLFLIAGMFSLSEALEITGGVAVIANAIASVIGTNCPDIILITVLWLTVNLVSEFMSSTAAILLMIPVCLELATIYACEPAPLLFALFAGGLCVNATPYAAPTNAMIYEPGGYNFMDYVKCGVPSTIVCGIASILAIYVFFPLHP